MDVIFRREWCRLVAASLAAYRLQLNPFSIALEQKAREENQSLLQQVRGIDHIRIAVRDLEKAKDQYRDILGFNLPPPGKKGIHPTGSENSSARFADNYLELIAVHDRDKVLLNRPWLIDFLQKREGGHSLALEVSSAQATANFLRSHEFSVTDPVPGTIMREGDKEPPPPLWWLVDFKEPVLPGGVIFFIQYAHSEGAPAGTSRAVSPQANTSQGISAVWMVVADLKKAVKAYASVGLRPKGALELRYLGATAHEIDAGRGLIVLVHPAQANGYAASFMKQSGEGIMGVSLAVANLGTAGRLLANNIGRPFVEYDGAYGKSILIPGEMANGLWIEMHENRSAS